MKSARGALIKDISLGAISGAVLFSCSKKGLVGVLRPRPTSTYRVHALNTFLHVDIGSG
jgi:hypothetical protein